MFKFFAFVFLLLFSFFSYAQTFLRVDGVCPDNSVELNIANTDLCECNTGYEKDGYSCVLIDTPLVCPNGQYLGIDAITGEEACFDNEFTCPDGQHIETSGDVQICVDDPVTPSNYDYDSVTTASADSTTCNLGGSFSDTFVGISSPRISGSSAEEVCNSFASSNTKLNSPGSFGENQTTYSYIGFSSSRCLFEYTRDYTEPELDDDINQEQELLVLYCSSDSGSGDLDGDPSIDVSGIESRLDQSNTLLGQIDSTIQSNGSSQANRDDSRDQILEEIAENTSTELPEGNFFSGMFSEVSSRLGNSALVQTFSGVANILNLSSAQCPDFSIDLPSPINSTVSTTVHCTVMDSVRTPLSAVMHVVFVIAGFRIVASA